MRHLNDEIAIHIFIVNRLDGKGHEDGKWEMEDGKWEMADGRWKMVNSVI